VRFSDFLAVVLYIIDLLENELGEFLLERCLTRSSLVKENVLLYPFPFIIV
jgi:hypothetical protein